MKTRIGLASSFGWVRFPERDLPLHYCWELPNGDLRFSRKGGSFCVVQHEGERPFVKPMMSKAGKADR